jgi:hypothetical protein
MSGKLAGAMTSHPIEAVAVLLFVGIAVFYAFGFMQGVAFLGVFFVGLLGAILLMIGAFFITQSKVLVGVIAILAGFGMWGAIAAGWVGF